MCGTTCDCHEFQAVMSFQVKLDRSHTSFESFQVARGSVLRAAMEAQL